MALSTESDCSAKTHNSIFINLWMLDSVILGGKNAQIILSENYKLLTSTFLKLPEACYSTAGFSIPKSMVGSQRKYST